MNNTRRLLAVLFSVGMLVACAVQIPPALAQSTSNATVVAVCGTPPNTYVAGQNRPLTQSTGGKNCVDAAATITVSPLTSSNLAGSIAVTNTFQSIQASTAGRQGCLIQNQSATNAMWVFFGSIGSATKAKSFILDSTHGLAISCAVGGLGVVTDQVSITGTAADLFNASFQ